jgi:hypothetical protein
MPWAAAALVALLAACGPAALPMPAPVPAPDSAPATTPVSDPAPARGHPAAPSDTLAPGVVHRFTWREEGPWAIHVVELDPRVCGVALRSSAALHRVVGVEATSSMARRGGPAGSPALVAINADFFRAEPFGVPEGPQVAAGVVVVTQGAYGPSVAKRFGIRQPVFGMARGAGAFVGEAMVAGSAWADASGSGLGSGSGLVEPGGSGGSGGSRPLARVNGPPGADSLALYNGFAGGETPADTGVVEVVVRIVVVAAAAGDTARGVVVAVDTLPAGVEVPMDGVVLAGRGLAADWLRTLTTGDSVAWTLPFQGAPGPVEELVGGFPLLLLDGEPALDRVPAIREAFAARRHPRSAVAIRSDGTILLVTVDGRQPGYSDGMTLPELTDLLVELGATDALNLDGGGSTALVVRGVLVNRPSDPVERAVANALLVPGAAAGECPTPDA